MYINFSYAICKYYISLTSNNFGNRLNNRMYKIIKHDKNTYYTILTIVPNKLQRFFYYLDGIEVTVKKKNLSLIF